MERKIYIIMCSFCFWWSTNVNADNHAGSIVGVRVVVESGQYDFTECPLCIIPQAGLYVAIGDTFFPIDAYEGQEEFALKRGIDVEDVIYLDTDIVIKQGASLLSYSNGNKPIFSFDTSDFKIFPTTDNNIFVTFEKDSLYYLMCVDKLGKKVQGLSSFDEPVVYVVGDDALNVVVTKSKIYYFKDNEGKKLLEYIEPIITAAMTRIGLLFATKKGLHLLRSVNKVTTLLDIGCHRIISDMTSFYIEYADGSIIWYDLAQIGH